MPDDAINLESLFTLSYGLYIIGSVKDGRVNGQISNTVMQITDSPPLLAAAINKKSLTHEFILASGVMSISVLSESAPFKLIGLFGFKSGRDVDKFSQVPYQTNSNGCPFITEHSVACMDMEVETEKTLDCDTHTIFIARLVGGRIMGQGTPMTYAYYREVIGGKTPPTAPTYRASALHREKSKNG